MLNPWKGVSAAIFITGVACGLIALEIADRPVRRWWALHAFTTDAVAGLVVLLITILVVDQVVRFQQVKNRSRATAAQAAILMAQASRSVKTVTTFLQDQNDRDAASDGGTAGSNAAAASNEGTKHDATPCALITAWSQ